MATSNPQPAPEGADPTDHVPYVPLVTERFEEQSAGALAPEDLRPYHSARTQEWDRYSGYGRDLSPSERAECNRYHDQRRRTRRNEALRPGRIHQRVPLLDVRDYKGSEVVKLSGLGDEEKARARKKASRRGLTMQVKHPETKEKYLTRPTRWRDGQGVGVPEFVHHSNALTGTEKAVLGILWSCKSHWHWHVEGDAYVHKLTQASIGDKIASGHSRRRALSDEGREVLTKARAGSTWQLDDLRRGLSGSKREMLDDLLRKGYLAEGEGGEVALTEKGRDELDEVRQVGLHHSSVSRVVSSLDEKGFLTFNRGGDGAPGEYYLACQEKAGWTYAALDPHSGRARIVKMRGHTKKSEDIDWQRAVTTTWKPCSRAAMRRKRAERARAQSRMQEEAARLRRRPAKSSTGSGMGQALASIAADAVDEKRQEIAKILDQELNPSPKERQRQLEERHARNYGKPPPDD